MNHLRKEFKAKAKKVLKKHYLILVTICLAASLVGVSFDNSLGFMQYQNHTKEEINESLQQAIDQVNDYKDKEDGTEILGHKDGVLASVVNLVSSGSLNIRIIQGLNRIINSTNITIIILTILSVLIIFTGWFFITNSITVIQARLFLEGRIYDKVPSSRITYLFKIKKWIKSCFTIFVKSFYLCLWILTIVGGFIKLLSYALVPYIVAENPDIKANEAITLSRKLMNGHKWELFVIEVSFLGWELLSVFTLGLSKILFSDPYKKATICEFYAKLRNDAKKEKTIENINLLDDEYLYKKATDKKLRETYDDVLQKLNDIKTYEDKPITFKDKVFDFFGIASRDEQKELNYELSEIKSLETKVTRDELFGNSYPTRLFKFKTKNKKFRKENLNHLRRYKLSSIFLIFMITSFIGWVWEVSFHLITDGRFVNRGAFYGPWLPIYGFGSLLILLLLNKLRKRPVISFFTTIVVCGIVEYFTSYFMEIANNGTRWWDYSGYFLNLHGRICAEGLIVFGIGGLAVVYFIAPFLDNRIKKIPKKILYTICSILLVIFVIDKIYSGIHPNTGEGITDYSVNHNYYNEKI